MRRLDAARFAVSTALVLALFGTVRLRAEPVTAANLWEFASIRGHPLDLEAVGSPRQAPLVLPQSADWLNTADSWVAPRVPSGSAATAAAAGTDSRQLLVEEFYFSLTSTADGPSRIYCAVARPAETTGPVPVVLVFHGGGGHASPALALAGARRHPGMAAVAMDYNGQFAARKAERMTDWKFAKPAQRLDLVPDLRNSPMYHYVTAARRTIDVLETLPWADRSRIGAMGVSYGGWVALILAGVDDRVKCVTTGVSAGGVGNTPGKAAQQLRWEPAEQRPLWLEHYEPLAHAARTRAGVFLQLASNDYWFWITGARRQLAALPGPKGWIIRPNSNHGAGGPEVSDLAAPAFMRHVLLGAPPLPVVSDFTAHAGGEYRWRVESAQPVRRAALCYSPGRVGASARYWMELSAESTPEGWRALLPAHLTPLAGQVFVNILTAEGLAVSGPLVDRDGSEPTAATAATLWDQPRGAAAWRTPGGWFPATEIAVTPSGALALRPAAETGAFCALTNSVTLARGRAATARGIRVRLDAGTAAGTVTLSLERDSMSLDERAWQGELRYPAGTSTHELPWSAFQPDPTARNSTLLPFDALRLSGERPDKSALLLLELSFLP
jgi:dienelactone hydrolase